jgi:hypothetical protein
MEDLPLEQARTFAHLRALLIRLHELAGSPGVGAIRRSTAAESGVVTLSRGRILLILRGASQPTRDELRALLHVYRVPAAQGQRWVDAWARAASDPPGDATAAGVPSGASGHAEERDLRGDTGGAASGDGGAPGDGSVPGDRTAGIGSAGTGAGLSFTTASGDDLPTATARQLFEVSRRCAERLRRLKGELASAHAQTDPDDPDSSTRLVRSLDFALRQLEDIIDDACSEALAIASATATGKVAGRTTGADGAGGSNGGPRAPGDRLGGSAELSGDDAGDQTLAWLSAVQEAVPLPVVAHLLKALRDLSMFNHIAQERPRLMAELLAVLPPADAADWLQTWEQDAAAEALGAAESQLAAAHLTLMPAESGAGLLCRMNRRSAATVLAGMRREPAARLLAAMDPLAGASMLERMERDAATARLLWIRELDPDLALKLLHRMSADAASELLHRMDQDAANRRQARDLLEKIRHQHEHPEQ